MTVPALVLTNRQDPIHPFAYGEIIAGLLPHAKLKALTSKSVSVEQHAQQTQEYSAQFLATYR